MKLRVCRVAGSEPKNLQIIREIVEATPDDGEVMLGLIVGTPYPVCHREKNGKMALVSTPLLPELLDDPEAAGKLSTATAHFIISLSGTEHCRDTTSDCP
jgi:hypothetical protein